MLNHYRRNLQFVSTFSQSSHRLDKKKERKKKRNVNTYSSEISIRKKIYNNKVDHSPLQSKPRNFREFLNSRTEENGYFVSINFRKLVLLCVHWHLS